MNKTENDHLNQITEATRLALVKAFAKLNCHTVVNEDGSLRAWYNGRFVDILFHSCFVRIWDLYWKTFCPGDPGLPYFREAVNSANWCELADIIYCPSEDMELTYLHSKVDFWFVPELISPDLHLAKHLEALDKIKESFNSHLKTHLQ